MFYSEPAKFLFKFRCNSGIIGLELNRSVSEKMCKRAEMPFMKVNGESEIRESDNAKEKRIYIN